MSVINPTVPLVAAADYAAMRTEAYAAIERLAHQRWTDYNAHDPGITLLEHLLDALAEIGYRGSFDIADLLTTAGGSIDYRQPFFTARNIFTNAPLTDKDYRRLLIDSQLLANAWINRKVNCDCGPQIYPECREGGLRFAPRWRLLESASADEHEKSFTPRGFNDVFLQFAPDAEFDNLNSNRMDSGFSFVPGGNNPPVALQLEFRFPQWRHWSPTQYDQLMDSDVTVLAGEITDFRIHPTEPGAINEQEFRQRGTQPFFIDLELTLESDNHTFNLSLRGVSMIVSTRSREERELVTPADLITQLTADQKLFAPYISKLQKRHDTLAGVGELLHRNRNLGEDFCRYDYLQAEDVAVCAEVQLASDADLELVLAQFYHRVEQHLSPGVPFRTLAEMEERGLAAETIFSGPALTHGFLLDADLDAARRQPVIYVSDVLNDLVEIEGVLAIEKLRFTVYDDWGRQGETYREMLPVTPNRYPALYLAGSGVKGTKEGLPLTARQEELRSILVQLRAEATAQALPTEDLDYPIPQGTHRAAGRYLPVQRTLPETYGLSLAGPPAGATSEHLAKIRQLAAFLMPFEVITAHTETQLLRFADLFSTDEGVQTTMPLPTLLEPDAPLAHLQELLVAGTDQQALAQLLEEEVDFLDRRNRFLDHLLARFGESITNYPLLLHDQDKRLAYSVDRLIADKIRFLRFYPEISGPRGLGVNYRSTTPACSYGNRSGIGNRLRRLLGMADIRSFFQLETNETEQHWATSYSLRLTEENHAANGLVIAPAPIAIGAPQEKTPQEAEAAAWGQIKAVIAGIGNATATYADEDGLRQVKIADTPLVTLAPFSEDGNDPDLDKAEAAFTKLVLETLRQERLFVVEHILLRPKFPGDALMTVCLAEDCNHQHLQDPYSFRITYVMPAEVKPFSIDMDLRRYAEQLIRRETPVHLLPKICWIDDRKRADELTEEDRAALDAACRCPAPDERARLLSRFEAVWCEWLSANAEITSWTDEVAEMEASLLVSLPTGISPADLRLFLGYFGDRFREEIGQLAEAGTPPGAGDDATFQLAWTAFSADLDRIKTRDINLYRKWGTPDAAASREALRDRLRPFYLRWQTASYRLHRLLLIFEQLKSVYPEATLHDCDDGDDDNPVRLDQTSLGTL